MSSVLDLVDAVVNDLVGVGPELAQISDILNTHVNITYINANIQARAHPVRCNRLEAGNMNTAVAVRTYLETLSVKQLLAFHRCAMWHTKTSHRAVNMTCCNPRTAAQMIASGVALLC